MAGEVGLATRFSFRMIKSLRNQSIAVALSAAILYWFTARLDFSYDSLTYALTIEFSRSLPIHPYHVLACLPGLFLTKLFQLAGFTIRSLFVMQKLNAILGGASVGYFYFALSRKFVRPLAIVGTTMLAFAFAVWSEMTDPGSYAFALLMTVIVTSWLLESPEDLLIKGMIHGLGVCLHGMLFLSIPSMLVWMVLGIREPRQRIRGLAKYFGGLAVVMAVVYGWALSLTCTTFSQAIAWIFGPPFAAPNMSVTNNPNWSTNVLWNLKNLWQGLYGGFLFVSSGNKILFALVQVAFVAVIAATIYFSVRAIKSSSPTKPLVISLWIWIAAQVAFQFFYAPAALRFRILFLPALILLFVVLISTFGNRPLIPKIALVLIISVVVINAGAAILPATRLQNSKNLVRTLELRHALQGNDLFIFAGAGDSITNVYVAYFAPMIPARSLYGYLYSHPQGNFSELDHLIETTRKNKGHVYVDAAVFDGETQKFLEAPSELPAGALQKWLGKFKRKIELRQPDGYRLFEI